MTDKVVTIKVAVPANVLAYGDTEDKAVRTQAADVALKELRAAVESAARNAGSGNVSLRDFEAKYTRKGNLKASFVASVPRGYGDDDVQTRVIAALNPLSQRHGASNLDVQVADLDA